MSHSDISSAVGRPQGAIDARGPRFGAAITTVLIVIALYLSLTGSSVSGAIVGQPLSERAREPGFIAFALVALFFAWSLVLPRTQPIQWAFRALVQPRLAPATEWEDPRPPRFAQAVGLIVVGLGLVLHLAGVPWGLVIAGSAALVAAGLNAAIGLCLGCEIYLLLLRAGLVRNARPVASR